MSSARDQDGCISLYDEFVVLFDSLYDEAKKYTPELSKLCIPSFLKQNIIAVFISMINENVYKLALDHKTEELYTLMKKEAVEAGLPIKYVPDFNNIPKDEQDSVLTTFVKMCDIIMSL